jgi:hypothetical protein
MIRLFKYCILLLLVFSAGGAMAQLASNTNKNKTKISVAGYTTDNTGAAAKSDVPVAAAFRVESTHTNGILTVKTDCSGTVYFYSSKGKEKGSCLVNEGTSFIYLEDVLNPGEYTCKFEGVNGSSGEVKVFYKP